MNIKDKIIEVSKLLDELDDFEEKIPQMAQYYDYRLSDLYHKLETMALDSKKCYRFCKELKEVLKERREWKTNRFVFSKYQSQRDRLNSGKNNRQFLLANICKEETNIRSSIYKNRVYTEEELVEKIGE